METCLNSVPPDYIRDLVAIALVLITFALAGLIYTAIHMRRSVVGERLLEVCGGDWQAANLAIENVREENSLMAESILRDFHKKGRG